jgi:hypothetical protein
MKKFPDNSEWSHSIMPKSAPKGTNGGSEQQLPQPHPGQKGKIKPYAELTAADRKRAVQPGHRQLQTDQPFAQPRKPSVEGAEHIGRSSEEHPLQKAAQK